MVEHFFFRWYHVIAERRSRRRYDPKLIEQDILEHLQRVCEEFRPFPQTRAALVTQSPDKVFRGIIGHYGKIKGAPAFIGFIGERDDPHISEKIGYSGEGIILEATGLKLGTCWVGVLFRPKEAALLTGIRENEKIFAVTPIGYAREDWSLEEKILTGFGRSHHRKPLTELVTGLEEEQWPHWIKMALEAARCAPSAVNRQPWRFYIENDSITISVDSLKDTFNIPKRLDCGIAMLHIEVAAYNFGVKGKWVFLEAPRVGRFRIT